MFLTVTFSSQTGIALFIHSPVPPPQEDARTKPQWLFPVSISVMVHGVLLWVLSIRDNPPPLVTPPAPESIKSYLYTAPVKHIEPDPEPVSIPEPIPEPEPETAPDPEPDTEISEVNGLRNEAEKDLPPQDPIQEQLEPEAVSPQKTPEKQKSFVDHSRDQKSLFRSGAQKQLQQVQDQAYQTLLQQQTAQYRSAQSQATTRPSTIPVLSETQKLAEQTQIKANCSHTLNRSLALLSGITGGTVKCSKPPPINEFIKKRLEKRH